jgi:hypothetical protein
MNQNISISPEEAADRVAIRELIEAYAQCGKSHMALFTAWSTVSGEVNA